MVLLLLGWISSSILGGCLARQSPLSKPLYAIVRHKNVRVADVLNQTPLNIAFTRVLRDGRWER
jgi:hypothetical protein